MDALLLTRWQFGITKILPLFLYLAHARTFIAGCHHRKHLCAYWQRIGLESPHPSDTNLRS
jgi:hypothetical protein